MKNKKDERERFIFRVILRLSRRSVGAKGDVSRIMILSVSAWIIAAVSVGFAESFTNWPTAGEMEDIVRLGSVCAKGLNERCWATQYSTNPVRYQVAPFTNNSEFYLDQSLVQSMAIKSRSLVPWYVKPETVYDGATNTAMLTVTGLWASLGIGNGKTNFTLVPASGTNPATYGDSPWRIYVTNLQERYKVLYDLNRTRPALLYTGGGPGGTACRVRTSIDSNYVALLSRWATSVWTWGASPASYGTFANRSPDGANWEYNRASILISNVTFVAGTNLTLVEAPILLKTIQTFGDLGLSVTNRVYYDEDYETTAPNKLYFLVSFPLTNLVISSIDRGYFDTVTPLAKFEPFTGVGFNVYLSDINVYPLWRFYYCTVPLR